MKKLIAVIAIIGCSLTSYSQIRFGPILGLNVSKGTSGTSNGVEFETEAKVLPQIGAIASYSLRENIDLESGLIANFKGQNFTYKNNYTDYFGITKTFTEKGERNFLYLSIPISISYNKLLEKGKIGFLTGPELSVLVVSDFKEYGATTSPLDVGWSIGIKGELNKGYGIRLQYCFGLVDTWDIEYGIALYGTPDFTTRNNEFKISLYYLFGGGII
jgi:hypothetical protein